MDNPRSEHNVIVTLSRINKKIREALGLEKKPSNNLIQNGEKLNKASYYRLVIDPWNVKVKRNV